MFSLNPQATPFTPSTFSIVKVPIYNDGKISAVRVLNSDDFSREFLHDFDVSMVPDEDLFNPAVYPVSETDHEELAAVEAFNEEMAELEDLEHHEELHLLLQDRINALQHGIKQRPAKITGLTGAVFNSRGSRGA
ncbi:unnamed protein product, partial [Sphacelaria rigidula]